MNDAILILISFFSSMLTATVGLGGGLMLLAAMPGLVPTSALIPLHAVAQVGSNASRALFVPREIDRRIVSLYAAGAALGALAGAPLVSRLPTEYVPLLLGLFVLLMTWLPPGRRALRIPGGWAALGAVQTALSMFLGATGPLSAPLLLQAGLSKDGLVATHAAMMTVKHGLKVLAFALLGFSLRHYAGLALGLIAGVTLGSWAGTKLRSRIPEERFRKLLRWVLTLLALRMIFGLGTFS